MPTELERAAQIDSDIKEADAKRKADAEESANAGEKIDKILTHLDSLGKRMDAWEEKNKGGEEIEEKGDPKPLGADAVRKDSAAADAEEIEHFKAESGVTHKIAADSVLAQIQSHADRAATAWGKGAVQPWDGEGITAYRRRSAREHQQYSPAWKGVDLNSLSAQSLRNATAQIFADSIGASSSSESYGEALREVRRRDPETGHTIKEFYGSPMAWMRQFTGGGGSRAKFNLDAMNRRER